MDPIYATLGAATIILFGCFGFTIFVGLARLGWQSIKKEMNVTRMEQLFK